MSCNLVKLLRIEAPWFTCGAEINEAGTIIRAAPIVKYMIGWPYTKAIIYCAERGWVYGISDWTTKTDGVYIT